MEAEPREPQPTWMYKIGAFGRPESRLFDHPDDVPQDQGWVDTPAKLSARPKAEPASAKRQTPPKRRTAGRKRAIHKPKAEET